MYIRIFTFFLGFFAATYVAYGQESLTDTAWSLKRVLWIDAAIRTGSGNMIDMKKKRAELLYRSEINIKNIFETWNYIPTTDRTTGYTLTLQKYRLSCEIAAMKSVFWALGYPRTEDEIIHTLPHHNKPMDKSTGIWWDPDTEFVWLYGGSQSEKTGYGIYEWALAKYFHDELGKSEPKLETEAWNARTRPTDYTDKKHLTHLLSALDTWKHVILWADWCTAPEYEDGLIKKDKNILRDIFPISAKNTCKNYKWYRYFDWKTKTGKKVVALAGDHVFVLLGYIGKADSPTHIIVWDTDTGRHIYPTGEWMRKWSMMQYRSLTVSK